MEELEIQVKAIGMEFAVEWAPALTAVLGLFKQISPGPAAMRQGLAGMLTGISTTLKQIPGIGPLAGAGLDQWIKALNTKAAPATPGEMAAEARKNLVDSIASMEQSLDREIATFGKSAGAVREYELAQKGATQADLAAVHAKDQKLDQMREEAKLQDEAAKFRERNKSPLDHFKDTIGEVNKLSASGLLGGADAAGAMAAAVQELQHALGGVAGRNAGTPSLFGSQEAFSDTIHAGDQQQGMQQQIVQLLQQANDAQSQTKEYCKQIADELKQLGVAGN
jgi:hypothetical protein